jgi:hypothetical protein
MTGIIGTSQRVVGMWKLLSRQLSHSSHVEHGFFLKHRVYILMSFKFHIEKTCFFHGNIEYIYERASNPTLKRYYVILLS